MSDQLPAQVPDPGAPFLFSQEIMDAITAEEAKGIYTGERLKRLHPDKYAAILQLVTEGMAQRRVAPLLGVHHRTVSAVLLENAGVLDTLRSKLSPKLMQAASLQLDRLLDDPDCVPKNVIGLTIGQLLDKYQLLSGGPTQRIELERKEPTHEDYLAWLEETPEADAKVVSTIGCWGGKSAPMEGEVSAGDREAGEAQSEGWRDLQSPDSPRQSGSDTQGGTQEAGSERDLGTHDHPAPSAQGEARKGAGGVSNFGGGGLSV